MNDIDLFLITISVCVIYLIVLLIYTSVTKEANIISDRFVTLEVGDYILKHDKARESSEGYNRKGIFKELSEYCYLSDEDDYIEITEWYNGEGFDVTISSTSEKMFSLTWGEYEAMRDIIEQF